MPRKARPPDKRRSGNPGRKQRPRPMRAHGKKPRLGASANNPQAPNLRTTQKNDLMPEGCKSFQTFNASLVGFSRNRYRKKPPFFIGRVHGRTGAAQMQLPLAQTAHPHTSPNSQATQKRRTHAGKRADAGAPEYKGSAEITSSYRRKIRQFCPFCRTR